MKKLYTQKSLRKKWVTTFGRMMLMLLFSMTSIGLTAQVWTINYCSGLPSVTQSNLYGPMYSVATANATSRTASIYPSTQLAGIAAQQLTSIYFHTGVGNAGGMLGTPNLKIYLKEVTPDQWGTTALNWATETTGATLVYDGNPASAIGTGGGWKEFVFNSTFTYTGTQNLAVLTEYTNPVASNAITWSYEYTAPCMPATTGTATRYSNNTTGTLPATLATSNMRKAYIGFDFVVSCPAPTNVTVSGVTQTGAQFNWTAGGTETSWEYVVQPAGAGIPTAGTQTSATSLTLTTQLTANTNYEFYVRSNCGGSNGDSVWKGPYTFTTLCGQVTSMFEDFDSYATGSIVPNCWARIVPAASAGSQTISSTTPASGTRNMYQYASSTSTPVIVVLPEFSNINAGTHWLRFKARVSTAGGALEIGYVTDPTDAATFTVISTLLMDNTTYTAPDAEKTVIVPSTVPANARLAIRNSSDAKSYYWDDVYWEAVPTCLPPSAVSSANVTTTTADISWAASTTAPANGYTVYYSTVNTAPDGTTVLDATNSVTTANLTATLSGLTPSSTYFVWIRTNCSATDQSSWTGAPSFITLCAPVATMFEDFDSYPTGSIVPTCWARIVPATTPGSQTISSATPASGTRNIYQYASATTTPVIVVLPQFSNINAGTHWLRFKARVSSTGGAMEVGYVTDPADAATFTVISTLLVDNTTYTAPDAEKTVIIPSTVPANARIAIRNSSDAKSYYWDDVYWEAVPTCFVPEFITVSSVTSNTADISWTSPTSAPANGYDVYYNTTGVAPDATTVLDATNSVSVGAGVTAATITSLTPATTYYIWVRSKCGAADMSAWAPAPVVVTACVAFTVPYAENFDTTSTGTTTNNNAPTCWTYYEAPGSTGYGYVYGTATNVLSPPNSYYLYRASTTTGEMMLISPATTALSDGTNRVRFSAKSTNSGTLQVGTMDNAANPASFVVLQTFTVTNTFEEYTVNFPVGTATYFAFNNASAAAGNVYIDDIFVEEIPSCVKPTDVTVTNITQTGAMLNWTATVTLPATYDIYLSTSNTPPTALTTPTFSQVSGTSASLGTPPLTPSTTYYVWVRSYCNAGDQSVWTTPVSFTTLCSAFAAPFSESFSSGSLPNCWTNANPTTTSTSANAFWQFSGAPGYGTTNNGKPVATYAWVDASVPYVGEHSVQLITPQINLTGLANPYVRFEWFKNHLTSATGTLPAYDNNKLLVHVTTDGTTWTQIFADDTNSSTWRVVGIPLSAAYVGATIQVRFTVDKDVAGNGYFYDDVLLDEIAVLQDPTLSTYDVLSDAKEVSIYPNPFTDVVNISDAKDLKSVTVVDMSGRMVKFIANPGRQINLGELSAGLYILKLDYKDGTVKTVKAIKK